jgi:hypothetical protein
MRAVASLLESTMRISAPGTARWISGTTFPTACSSFLVIMATVRYFQFWVVICKPSESGREVDVLIRKNRTEPRSKFDDFIENVLGTGRKNIPYTNRLLHLDFGRANPPGEPRLVGDASPYHGYIAQEFNY